MPTFLRLPWLMGEIPDAVLASSIMESWPELVEILSKPGSIAIMLAGLLGLVVGLLLRGRGQSAAVSTETPHPIGLTELRWRHEKLVLMERQQVEKHGRLERFAGTASGLHSAEEMLVRLRVFLLSEGFREARQKVGTDLSRMLVVRDQLEAISSLDHRSADTIQACLSMVEAQAALLDSARDQLREIAEEALRIEECVNAGVEEAGVSRSEWRRELMSLKGRVLELPQGWLTSSEALDQQIRELLAPMANGEIEAVRDLLLIDGAMTSSLRESSRLDLPGSISGVIVALELAESAGREESATPDVTEEMATVQTAVEPSEFSEAPYFDGGLVDEKHPGVDQEVMTPDSGFRDPVEFEKTPLRNGRGFHDLTLEEPMAAPASLPEVESAAMVENRSLVLFCSNNVELWGKDIYRGAHCRARPVNDFPAWAQWISIKRLDSGERVFAPVKTASLFNGQTSDPVGFNGTNELFYGARHLGIFSDKCPNEVETRFTYGGWGFGHRAHETAPDVEQLQAAGWEGREIPADTVFEIVIHEELPKLGDQDRILETGGLNGKH